LISINENSTFEYLEQLTGRLQAGTANKETVNVGLGSELTAVLLADRATVDDTNIISSFGRDGLAEPLADSGVDLLSLLSGSDLAGTDSPSETLDMFKYMYTKGDEVDSYQTGS
jgi:hypothetical protein